MLTRAFTAGGHLEPEQQRGGEAALPPGARGDAELSAARAVGLTITDFE